MKYLCPCILIALLALPVTVLADKPILDIDTGGHKAKIQATLFTGDGRYLVSASDDKTIRVWDTSTGEIDRVLRCQIAEGVVGKIFTAALSPDDRLLAVGGYLGTYTGSKSREDEGAHKIRLINFQTGEVVAWLKGHTNVILGLAFSPDGSRFISGSADNTARIWDTRSKKTLRVLKDHSEDVYAVAFSPDGSMVATGSDDDTLKLWNPNTGRLIKTLTGHTGDVSALAFTPNGKYLVSGSYDKTIRLWDGKTGRFIKAFAAQNRSVLNVSVSPDSGYVVSGIGGSGSGGNECRVYRIPSGDKVTTFSKHRNIVLATGISPDGKTAATGGGSNKEIYLWDLTTGEVKHKLVGKGNSNWSVGFARDGRSIAWSHIAQTSGKMNFLTPLRQAFQLKSDSRTFEPAMGPEISSDDDYLRAVTSVGSLTIRTPTGNVHKTIEVVRNGKVLHKISRKSSDGYTHRSMTLTPDGQTIISGAGNGHLSSYSPQTGKRIHKFIGHTGAVWAVAVSPDSRLLASASGDQTVKLWEIDTGRLLLTIFRGTDKEWVAWTPEGYYTASLNGDNYVGWHINRGIEKSALYYPASRFSRQFYSPQIVAKYLETGGDIKEAIRLANLERPRRKQIKETSKTDLKNLLPPVVYFKTPAARNTAVTAKQVRVRAFAKSNNQEPIQDIWLLVNGRRLSNMRGIGVQAVNDGKMINGLQAEIDVVVPLTQTNNRISVVASNRHSQSEPEVINVTLEAKPQDLYKPDLYLLAIGVSKYKQADYNLDFAHKDAAGLSAALGKQEGRLYANVHRKVLTDRQATKDNILDGLDWMLKESTQKDVSVIFVAGHGLNDQRGNYYFLPHDGHPSKLRRSAVKWLEFEDVLTSLPSKVLLLVDTCHSGKVTGKRRGADDMTDALRDLITADSGVVVMTSSTGKESSQEHPEWGHGAFTKALLEGLDGQADYDQDRAIAIKELDLYVTKRVKKLTKGQQHPTTEIPKTMPDFPFVTR